MPSPASVHINQALTDFSLAYKNSQYFAHLMMPLVGVTKLSDSYYKRNLKDVITPIDDLIGPNSEPSEDDFSVTDASFTCRERGLIAYISRRESANADDVLELQRNRVASLLNRMALNREIRVADLLNTTTSFASANRITATAAWSDETNSHVIKDMQDARRSIRPGGSGDSKVLCLMTSDLWDEAARNPALLGLLGANADGLVSPDRFASYFRIDEMFISEAEKNTANRGVATPTAARIWDTDKVVMVRVPKSKPTRDSQMFGCHFALKGGGVANSDWVDEGGGLNDTVVVEWYEAKRGGGEGSDGYKAARAEVEAILMDDMGAIVSGC